MKKNFLISIIFFSLQAFSQDYMTKIAEKTCECLKHVPDSLDQEGQYMQLGLCMMSAAEPYKKQIKKDHDINMDQLDKVEGEKLGHIVGLKLATVCPDRLIAFSQKTGNAKKENGESGRSKFEGKVIKIDEDNFVSFTLKDNDGKAVKFYWLGFISSDFEMVTKYKTLLSRQLKISYYQKELFDAKTGEYRQFNIIDKLEMLSR